MAKMTKQEIKEWDELYKYVKTDIMNYDKDIRLPQNFVLRLKGLHEGKFMSNKNVKSQGSYKYSTILTTFKVMKYNILAALKESKKFKNESHKINYIMAMIENKINDIAIKEINIERSKEKSINVETIETEETAKYKKKTKDIDSNILNNLW